VRRTRAAPQATAVHARRHQRSPTPEIYPQYHAQPPRDIHRKIRQAPERNSDIYVIEAAKMLHSKIGDARQIWRQRARRVHRGGAAAANKSRPVVRKHQRQHRNQQQNTFFFSLI